MRIRRTHCTAALALALSSALAASSAFATYPGANGRILVERPDSKFRELSIHAVLPDGSGHSRLTPGTGVEGEAEWSPDGTKLVFARSRSFNPPYEIWVMNADGSGLRQLTRHKVYSGAPTWSPDGSKIAYVREVGRYSHLYEMNPDGSGKRRLLGGRRNIADPAYSPNGSVIALSLLRFKGDTARGFDASTALVGADGKGLRRLTAKGGSDELNPNWSPDGTQIAYEVNSRHPVRQADLAIMAADGSGARRLTRTKVHETNPVWAPDGTRIAFTSDRDNRKLSTERLDRGFELYTMALDGSDVRRLTRNRVPDLFPSWQPLK